MDLEYYKHKSEGSPWLSIEELADRMEVSVRTVRRRHAEGNGPKRSKRSRRYMYRREDVDMWLSANPARLNFRA